MGVYPLIVTVHIVAGALALLGYWSAAFARKGGRWHRGAGHCFLLAMAVVVVTGAPLAIGAWQAGHPRSALFLGYLLLLVSSGMWGARQAVRLRHDFGRYAGRGFRAQSIAVAVAGAGVSVMGVQIGSVVFIAFGLVGVLAGAASLRLAFRGPRDGRWWLREHYGAMIGNGVAVHIAFLGIGLRNALPGIDPLVQQQMAWLLPVGAAVLASVWLDRRYGRSSSPALPGRRNATT